MRFSKDEKTTDIYSSTFGTIELEYKARNMYKAKGGFETQGFPKKVYTDKNRGVCVETEKELLCEKEAPPGPVCEEGELLFKGICLKAPVDAKVLKAEYSASERPSILVRLGEQNTFFLQIYAQQGVKNIEDNHNNSQYWQKQYGDNVVDHYEILDVANKVYEVFLPPLKIFEGSGENREIFYRVETFKYFESRLVEPKHIEYQSFNLITRKQEYKFHRSPRGVETLAKINYAPYTNQWIDENGKQQTPNHGWKGCGPTSLVIAASAFNMISKSDYGSLRSYVYDDRLWNDEGKSLPTRSCDQFLGAYARVMVSCEYQYADWYKHISIYNNTLKKDFRVFEWRDGTLPQDIYMRVKDEIDAGNLIHSGASVPGVPHQLVIRGYGVESDLQWQTNRVVNSAIVNDSFTDMTIDNNGDGVLDRNANGYVDYTTLGYGAVYTIGTNNLLLGRNFIVVSK